MAIEWVELFIGGCIGGVVGFSIQKTLEIISNAGVSKDFPYIGTFHSYHYSTTGSGEMVHQVWSIQKKLNGKIEINITEPEPDNGFSFKGELWVEERHIYAQVKGVKHIERMFFIFPEPVSKQLGFTVGVASALTMQKQPWSGKQLLSGKEMSIEDVKKKLGGEQRIVSYFA